jgi:hypothetical protein
VKSAYQWQSLNAHAEDEFAGVRYRRWVLIQVPTNDFPDKSIAIFFARW